MHRSLLLIVVAVACKPADQAALPKSGFGHEGPTVALASPIGYVKVGDGPIVGPKQ